MNRTDRLTALEEDLRALYERRRSETLDRYGRMNPFYEDLFDWKERARAWTEDERGVTIYNSTTVMGDVEIGHDTWVGPFCLLDGSGAKLAIGHHCAVSVGAQLLTHDTIRWTLSGGRADYEGSPVTIGDCTFIGTHAIVPRGVSIGHQCLVAAGAVVTRDVADNVIVGGVPAVPIGMVEVEDDGTVYLSYG